VSTYPYELMMTPFKKLKSLPNVDIFLGSVKTEP